MKNFPLTKRLRYFIVLSFLATATVFILPNNSTAQTANANVDSGLQYWKTYSFEDVNFKVSFPAEPNRVPLSIPNEGLIGVLYGVSTTGAMFEVLQVNMPPTITGEELKTHFDFIVDFGIKQLENRVGDLVKVSDKNISRGSLQIREYVLERGTVSSKLRFFLQGKKVYIAGMTRFNLPNMPDQLEKIYQAESDKFFNSFQIVDNKPQGVRKTKGKAK